MAHIFEPELAKVYGVDGAILLQHLMFWIEKNMANGKHLHDGKYWTYNSVKAFDALFPYWTSDQIRRRLEKLEEQGAIVRGNYNKSAYDRTSWYSVCKEVYDVLGNSHNHLAELPNESGRVAKPIPDVNTNNKQKPSVDSKEIDEVDSKSKYQFVFDHFVSKKNLVSHRKYTDGMYRAIKRAKRELSLTDEEFKTVIDRHSEIVRMTSDNGKYAVKAQGLSSLFGEKAFGKTHLKCAEYLDDGQKYIDHLKGKQSSKELPKGFTMDFKY